MVAPYPIAWEAEDSERFVGRLTLRADEFELDGTATSLSRPRRVVVIQRAHITNATVEQVAEWPAVRIVTSHTVYFVEILAGGRGAAMALADDLAPSLTTSPVADRPSARPAA